MKLKFGTVEENVVTREEFPLEKAREVLKNEVIAVLGYGVQGPGQALNLKDNGFNVIIGQRKGSKTWDKAVADGWVPGETLFELEEACEKGTILQFLLSDAGQIALWPTVKKHLTPGKALYFSHGFGITYKRENWYHPSSGYRCDLVAPKGSGTSLRRIEVTSDLTGERGTLMGAIQGILLLSTKYCVPMATHHLKLQRNCRRIDTKFDAASGRKRHGLDVCQLLHYCSTRCTRLVETIQRCDQASV
ncbi:hypothetical protein GHT06_004031 [Daphnia sinensis]|uniref:KARI N-terminal Rossmann domain-containing protein n=1 Tax=Daphnia sinensis TaxID=1820382 RepID=A0AAD5KU45_9CRUS|nr:hypothetical protein GHT06_004031 [Daphnia sinensis]